MLRTMLKFTKSDFIINKRVLLLNLAIWLVLAGWIFRTVPLNMFLLVGILYAAIIAVSPMIAQGSMSPAIMGVEYKVDILYASLPNKRSTIVLARYFTSLVIMLAMVVLNLSYGLLLGRLMPVSQVDIASILSLGGLFYLIFFGVVVICIFLPFIYRFGLMGIMIALVAGLALGALGVAMEAVLKYPAIKDSVVARVLKSVLSTVFSQLEGSGIPGLFQEAIGRVGMPLFIILIVLIMIAFLFVSFKISVYIFDKKEL